MLEIWLSNSFLYERCLVLRHSSLPVVCSVYRILCSKTILSLQKHISEKNNILFSYRDFQTAAKRLIIIIINGEIPFPSVRSQARVTLGYQLPGSCCRLHTGSKAKSRYFNSILWGNTVSFLCRRSTDRWPFRGHKVSFNCLFNKKYISWNEDGCITGILAVFSNLSLACKQTPHLESKVVFCSG